MKDWQGVIMHVCGLAAGTVLLATGHDTAGLAVLTGTFGVATPTWLMTRQRTPGIEIEQAKIDAAIRAANERK